MSRSAEAHSAQKQASDHAVAVAMGFGAPAAAAPLIPIGMGALPAPGDMNPLLMMHLQPPLPPPQMYVMPYGGSYAPPVLAPIALGPLGTGGALFGAPPGANPLPPGLAAVARTAPPR